tara:strand:+ start:589 stop:1380 length:792 start_codon:yes stop_codon:yes gene_type:complete
MTEQVTAVLAASLILIRDGSSGLEILMVVRSEQASFAPGALVFTGGKVDAGDQSTKLLERCDGSSLLFPQELAFRVAAIREAFEEGGVILARESSKTHLLDGSASARLQKYRRCLAGGSLALSDFLCAKELVLACDRLTAFAHWITPSSRPMRFDTHFFLAEAPSGQKPTHDGIESMNALWLTPASALENAREGRWNLMLPTRLNLERLSHAVNVSEALESARNTRVVTVTPWIEKRSGVSIMRIPDDAGYGYIAEPINDVSD